MKLIDYKNKITNQQLPVNIFQLDIDYYNAFTPMKRVYSGRIDNVPVELNEYEIIKENINVFTNNTNLYIYKY